MTRNPNTINYFSMKNILSSFVSFFAMGIGAVVGD